MHRFLIKEEFLITQDGVTVQVQLTQAIANGLWLALAIALPEPMSMTLRIERFKDRIRLSGELRIAHLEQVKSETEGCEATRDFGDHHASGFLLWVGQCDVGSRRRERCLYRS